VTLLFGHLQELNGYLAVNSWDIKAGILGYSIADVVQYKFIMPSF